MLPDARARVLFWAGYNAEAANPRGSAPAPSVVVPYGSADGRGAGPRAPPVGNYTFSGRTGPRPATVAPYDSNPLVVQEAVKEGGWC